MSASDDSERSAVLSAVEERFVPRQLRDSLRFLRDSREARRGWPRYPGLPSTLHDSALVVEMLSLIGDDSLDWLLAAGAGFIRDEYVRSVGENYDNVEVSLDLLRAATADSNSDSRSVSRLAQVLYESVATTPKNDRILTTQFLSEALLVLHRYKAKSSEHHQFIDLLVGRHRRETGGWPATEMGVESFVPTSWATRALADCESNDAKRAVAGGVYYIHSQVKENGWDSIAEVSGTLAVCLGLRALVSGTKDTNGRAQLIKNGTQWLRDNKNEDGGWGGGPDEVSSIEYTSHAVIALLENGDNRFVPARVALDLLKDAETSIQELTKERNKLVDDYSRRIEEYCGGVVVERDKLRNRLKKEEHKVKELQVERTSRAQREADLENELLKLQTRTMRADQARAMSAERLVIPQRTVLRPHLWKSILLGVGVGAGFTTAAIFSFFNDRNPVLWISFSIVGLLTLTLSLYRERLLSRQSRRVRRETDSYPSGYPSSYYLPRFERVTESREESREDAGGPSWYHLVELFRYATDSLSGVPREELVYRLLRDAVDIPPDYSRRYVNELMSDLKIPPKESQRLEAWLERLMDLDVESRRAVILQLRRAIL